MSGSTRPSSGWSTPREAGSRPRCCGTWTPASTRSPGSPSGVGNAPIPDAQAWQAAVGDLVSEDGPVPRGRLGGQRAQAGLCRPARGTVPRLLQPEGRRREAGRRGRSLGHHGAGPEHDRDRQRRALGRRPGGDDLRARAATAGPAASSSASCACAICSMRRSGARSCAATRSRSTRARSRSSARCGAGRGLRSSTRAT